MVGGAQVGGDALVLLNDAFLPDAVLIDVPAGVTIPDPILVVHWCEGPTVPPPGTVPCSRAPASVSATARAPLWWRSMPGRIGTARSLVVPVTELMAARRRSLSYVSLQILNDAAWSIARLAARSRSGLCHADVHNRTRW